MKTVIKRRIELWFTDEKGNRDYLTPTTLKEAIKDWQKLSASGITTMIIDCFFYSDIDGEEEFLEGRTQHLKVQGNKTVKAFNY